MNVVDLFAGAGGWDIAARQLGLEPLGIECDVDACETRRRAGLRTMRADVAVVDVPHLTGLIASPPCPAFSYNGTRAAAPHFDELVTAMRTGDWDWRPTADAPTLFDGPYAALPDVWLPLEVGRWVELGRPDWIACEQVVPARPLWTALAEWLNGRGYSTAVEVVDAVDSGVAQYRQRAVLVASLADTPALPPPTVPTRACDALGLPLGSTVNTGRNWKRAAGRSGAQSVPLERPVPTVTAGSIEQWHLHLPGRPARMFTSAELGVLQGFPIDYPWAGTVEQRGRQIGNAVPPPVAHRILTAATTPT